MAVIRADLVYAQAILEDDLQAVLWFPIAVALQGNIDALVAISTASHQRLTTQLDVTPDISRRFDCHILVIARFPIAVAILIVPENKWFGFRQHGWGNPKEVCNGDVKLVRSRIVVIFSDHDSADLSAKHGHWHWLAAIPIQLGVLCYRPKVRYLHDEPRLRLKPRAHAPAC